MLYLPPMTHSTRWRTAHKTVGIGHLYQDRYKSFPVQDSIYYLTLVKYVESNPLRAKLVGRSADWPWSSLAIRCKTDKPITLSDGPVALPRRRKTLVDSFVDEPLDEMETSESRPPLRE